MKRNGHRETGGKLRAGRKDHAWKACTRLTSAGPVMLLNYRGALRKNMRTSHAETTACKRVRIPCHFSLGSSNAYWQLTRVVLREKRKAAISASPNAHTPFMTRGISPHRLTSQCLKAPFLLLFLLRAKPPRFAKMKNKRGLPAHTDSC